MSDKELVKEAVQDKPVSALYSLPIVKTLAQWSAKHVGLTSVNDLPAWAVGEIKRVIGLVKAAIAKPSFATVKPAVVAVLQDMYNPAREIALMLGILGRLFRFRILGMLEKPGKVGLGLVSKAIKVAPAVISIVQKYGGLLSKASKVVK